MTLVPTKLVSEFDFGWKSWYLLPFVGFQMLRNVRHRNVLRYRGKIYYVIENLPVYDLMILDVTMRLNMNHLVSLIYNLYLNK